MAYIIKHEKFKDVTIYGLGNQLKTKKQALKWMNNYQKLMYKKSGFKAPEWKIKKI